MPHYRIKVELIVKADNADKALGRIKETLQDFILVSSSGATQVEQRWQDVHDGRGPG
jgi:hypothetical protein